MKARINKRLGWGLTELRHDENGRITDPRINTTALTGEPGAIGDSYLDYLESPCKTEKSHNEWNDLSMVIKNVTEATKGGQEPPWPIIHKATAGRPDVLLIQPIGFPKWSRYDDPIDHSEEHDRHHPARARVISLPDGIFPFSHALMNSFTGQPVDKTAFHLITRLLKRPDVDTDPQYRKSADHLARVSGFTDAAQAVEHTVTAVPADIRHLCTWTGIFTEPDTWMQLRPMAYTYWT